MGEIKKDVSLISYCGLYCAACRKYISGKCAGCRDNVKATWCKVRLCGAERKYRSCADCSGFTDLKKCGKLNNFISKIFALLFGSDRVGSLCYIREKGYEAYAAEMTEKKLQSLKKR